MQSAPGKRIGLRSASTSTGKPGATTLRPSTATSLLAVYIQALRIGAAAYDRLSRLLPVLDVTDAAAPAALDARRALRELDDALASTRIVTAPIAAEIASRRDALVAKRDALPADAVARLM
jgi:hypothetical protein